MTLSDLYSTELMILIHLKPIHIGKSTLFASSGLGAGCSDDVHQHFVTIQENSFLSQFISPRQ
jgi:hypothetical protein